MLIFMNMLVACFLSLFDHRDRTQPQDAGWKKIMLEIKGNILDFVGTANSIVCISGCWQVNKKRRLIMARGAACQAKHRWPIIADVGIAIAENPNPRIVGLRNGFWYAPSRSGMHDLADPQMITRMLSKIRESIDGRPRMMIYLTRFGCGSGGLGWDRIRPYYIDFFDRTDKVVVVSRRMDNGQ